jgi:hypothetical protein
MNLAPKSQILTGGSHPIKQPSHIKVVASRDEAFAVYHRWPRIGCPQQKMPERVERIRIHNDYIDIGLVSESAKLGSRFHAEAWPATADQPDVSSAESELCRERSPKGVLLGRLGIEGVWRIVRGQRRVQYGSVVVVREECAKICRRHPRVQQSIGCGLNGLRVSCIEF